ncbi:hypothetical protein KKH36_02995 [Patescibacteria group bacterium]|nr:hypothetical protein [Patescibacteria group bacterium]
MKRVCSYCKKTYGEKEPFDDNSITHGACEECKNKMMEEIDKMPQEEPKLRKGSLREIPSPKKS